MIASKLERLRELQEIPWRGRTDRETAELEQLRTELALEQEEKPDDPRTLLTDESSRPNLDGSNYNDTLHAMCRDELRELAVKYGLPALKVGFELLLKAP